MTMRRSNWPAKLALFIEEKRAQPFDWQANNCAFFASDWLAMSTGVDPAAGFRDAVDSPLSASRALKAAGGLEILVAQACARWGWHEVPLLLAQRGDLVTAEGEGGPAVGVCLGALAAFAGPTGVEYRPVAQCLRAWKIT